VNERGKENGVIPRNDPDKVNEAVERLTEAMWGSYEKAVENTAAMQESNSRFARSLFESNLGLLKAQTEIQAEINRHTLQSLAEQVREHREAFLELSRESLNAYDGFVDSLSLYYEEVSRESENPDG
jgi:uncharacterized membrane-anchored protein YjiN (DUF445 family)